MMPRRVRGSARGRRNGEAAAEEEWDVLATHGDHHEATFTLSEGTFMSVSASGDRLVFDLLGDIWSLPLEGGDAIRLTSDAAWDSEPRFSPDGTRIAFVSDRGGNENIWTMASDGSDLQQVTHEEEARMTDPVWDPAGDWLVVRRRTVDTRSIGVTELWQVHTAGGKGFRLTSLDSDPHAGEATVSADGRYVYFSTRNGRFQYDHDPVGGRRVARLDRKTGQMRMIVGGAGSAVRPELSADGTTLAFVSRDRTKTLLEVMDLETWRRRVVADWLDHDHMEGFALHGVYPDMAWLPSGELVLWAGGRLWRVGLDGARAEIPFTAKGTWTFHDVPRRRIELADEITAKVVRWPVTAPDGRIAFSAMGALWERGNDGRVSRVSDGNGYAPAWSPDGRSLAYTTWTDCPAPTEAPEEASTPLPECGGRLVVRQGRKTETLPIGGELVNPAWDDDGDRMVARGRNGNAEPGPANWEVVLMERGKRREWRASVVGDVRCGLPCPLPACAGSRRWSETRSTAPRTPGETVLKSTSPATMFGPTSCFLGPRRSPFTRLPSGGVQAGAWCPCRGASGPGGAERSPLGGSDPDRRRRRRGLARLGARDEHHDSAVGNTRHAMDVSGLKNRSRTAMRRKSRLRRRWNSWLPCPGIGRWCDRAHGCHGAHHGRR